MHIYYFYSRFLQLFYGGSGGGDFTPHAAGRGEGLPARTLLTRLTIQKKLPWYIVYVLVYLYSGPSSINRFNRFRRLCAVQHTNNSTAYWSTIISSAKFKKCLYYIGCLCLYILINTLPRHIMQIYRLK